MGTVSHAADTFGGQLEALVVDRFARAADDELILRRFARDSAGTASAVPEFAESLRELAVLATTRLQGVCTRLLAWRAAAQGRSKESAEGSRQLLPLGAQCPPGGDGCHADMPRLVDQLFADGLSAAIPAYTGANLDSEYADSIENILIDLVRLAPAGAGASAPAGHGEAHSGDGASGNPAGAPGEMAASVLASLSASRLLVIVGKVQTAIKLVPAADKGGAVRLMNMVGKLKLGLSTAAHMAQSAQTMRILSELSKDKTLKCYSQEVKHAAIDAAAHLLINTAVQRDPTVDYSPWDKALHDLWEYALTLRGKSKHALPALHLLSAIVTVLPDAAVDEKAASALKDHVFVILSSVKPAGTMSKFLTATGMGPAKTHEMTRLTGLQALHAILRRLQCAPPHLRAQSSKLVARVAALLKGVCQALSSANDARDIRDTMAVLSAVADILCLAAIPADIADWPAWRRAAAMRGGLYHTSSDGSDAGGGWHWCITALTAMLHSSSFSNGTNASRATGPAVPAGSSMSEAADARGEGACMEACGASMLALQRIVASLTLRSNVSNVMASISCANKGAGEQEGGDKEASVLLEQLREHLARPLAQLLEQLGHVSRTGLKDKRNPSCPAKMHVPLMVLHGVLVLFPALRPGWSQSRTITFLAGLTQHASESISQQAELALSRLLLSSAGAMLQAPCYHPKTQNGREGPEAEGEGCENGWNNGGRCDETLDMTVAAAMLREVAVVGQAVMEGDQHRSKAKERGGEREEKDARLYRAAQLLLEYDDLSLQLNEISQVAAVKSVSLAIDDSTGDPNAAMGWLDVVERFGFMCLCKSSPQLRRTGLRLLWLMSMWTSNTCSSSPPPPPDSHNLAIRSSQANALATVYQAALYTASVYRAQGRSSPSSSAQGAAVCEDDDSSEGARVPAAVTNPRVSWDVATSSFGATRSNSASMDARSSGTAARISSFSVWLARGRFEEDGLWKETEDSLVEWFSSSEGFLLRCEMLFDMVQLLVSRRPALMARVASSSLHLAELLYSELACFKANDALASLCHLDEWASLACVALSCACVPQTHSPCAARANEKCCGGGEGSSNGGGFSVQGLVEVLGTQLREGSCKGSVCAAALALGKVLSQARSSSAVLAADACGSSPMAALILRELAALETGGGGGSKPFKSKKHVCRMLLCRLDVLNVAADLHLQVDSGVPSSRWNEADGADSDILSDVISNFLETAADVVDYLGYLDAKYSKKDGKLESDKEAKRKILLSRFVNFIITCSPHLNRLAPAVAWSPLVRSRIFDVIVPLLQHKSISPLLNNDASTHSSASDKSIRAGGAGASVSDGGHVALRALRAIAALQSGPAIPVSSKAMVALGLSNVHMLSVGSRAAPVGGGSITELKQWVNKALLVFSGQWLLSSRDFLYNMLLGSTQALSWCLDCCYHVNRSLSHSHFDVFSRLILTRSVRNCATEEVMTVALYMLGDAELHVRQRAALLLRCVATSLASVYEWDLSLSEISGTDAMNPQRLALLQYRAADTAAQMVATLCSPGLVANCVGVLLSRIQQSSCHHQQHLLLTIARPWLAQLDLTAEDGLGGGVGRGWGRGGGGEEAPVGALIVADLLQLTRQLRKSLPPDVSSLWSALASHSSANVSMCIQCFLGICVTLLSSPDTCPEALSTVQVATDGVARAARDIVVDLLCSQMGARPLADQQGMHEPSDISPALVLRSGMAPFSSLANGDGSLFQVPVDDARPSEEARSCSGGGGGEGAGVESDMGAGGDVFVASKCDAAIVLLAASLDSLAPIPRAPIDESSLPQRCGGGDVEGGGGGVKRELVSRSLHSGQDGLLQQHLLPADDHACCLRRHAPTILHATLMCSTCLPHSVAGATSSGPCSAPSGSPDASQGLGGSLLVAEQVLRESCKWLLVLLIRLVSSVRCPYDPPCQNNDVKTGAGDIQQPPGERQTESSSAPSPASCAGGALCQMVEVADKILASNWLLVLHEKRDEYDARIVRKAGQTGVLDERNAKVCALQAGAEELIEAVLGLVHKQARAQVREEWSRHALFAACFLPCARAGQASLRPASTEAMCQAIGLPAASTSAGFPSGGEAGDAESGEIEVDAQWMARRKRSHVIYRALHAPVGVPDVIELLRSLAQSKGGGFKVGDEDVQVWQLETIKTLRHMVAKLDSRKLMLAPSLFWAAIALLHAPGRSIYEQAVLLFEDILMSIDIADTCTQNILFSLCPQGWTPAYNGVKPLIIRGLGHARTHAVCARLLHHTINARGGMLLDPTPHYTVICLIAQTPQLLAGLDGRKVDGNKADLAQIARDLASTCSQRGLKNLAQPLLNVAQGNCTSASELLSELSPPLCMHLYSSREALAQRNPPLAVDAARLLLYMLDGGPAEMRGHTLSLLLALVRGAPGGGHLQQLGSSFLTSLLRETHGTCGLQAEAIMSAISRLDFVHAGGV